MDWTEIGRMVETARIDKGWTRQEAQAASGVSVATWYAIENGRQEVYRRATLRDLCTALDWPRNRIAVWAGLEEDEDAGAEPADDAESECPDVTPATARRFDALDARLDRIERAMEKLAEQRARPRSGR